MFNSKVNVMGSGYKNIRTSLVMIIVCCFGMMCSKPESNKGRVVIAGLFPISESVPEGLIGRGVRPAVELALDMINKEHTVLPHHTLDIIDSDTKVHCLYMFISHCSKFQDRRFCINNMYINNEPFAIVLF